MGVGRRPLGGLLQSRPLPPGVDWVVRLCAQRADPVIQPEAEPPLLPESRPTDFISAPLCPGPPCSGPDSAGSRQGRCLHPGCCIECTHVRSQPQQEGKQCRLRRASAPPRAACPAATAWRGGLTAGRLHCGGLLVAASSERRP